eukprot:1160880-Pelagomonas_calceolata.AAC.5
MKAANTHCDKLAAFLAQPKSSNFMLDDLMVASGFRECSRVQAAPPLMPTGSAMQCVVPPCAHWHCRAMCGNPLHVVTPDGLPTTHKSTHLLQIHHCHAMHA